MTEESKLIQRWEQIAAAHADDDRAPVKEAYAKMKEANVVIEVIGPEWEKDEVAKTRFEMAAFLKKKMIVVTDQNMEINPQMSKWRDQGINIIACFKADVTRDDIPTELMMKIYELMAKEAGVE